MRVLITAYRNNSISLSYDEYMTVYNKAMDDHLLLHNITKHKDGSTYVMCLTVHDFNQIKKLLVNMSVDGALDQDPP